MEEVGDRDASMKQEQQSESLEAPSAVEASAPEPTMNAPAAETTAPAITEGESNPCLV